MSNEIKMRLMTLGAALCTVMPSAAHIVAEALAEIERLECAGGGTKRKARTRPARKRKVRE